MSATFGSQTAVIQVTVKAEDLVGVVSFGEYVPTRPGQSASLLVGVRYSVASAPSGEITVRFSDQNDIVATTSPMTATTGYHLVSIPATFTVPATSTKLCITAVLRVGSTTLTDTPTSCLTLTP